MVIERRAMRRLAALFAAVGSVSMGACAAAAQDAASAPTAASGKANRGIVFVPPTAKGSATQAAPAPSVGPAASVSTKPGCMRAFATADLTLDGEPRLFTDELAKRLRAQDPRVVVDVAAPFPDDARPAQLEPWLAAVARGGGVVRSTPITCGRGFSVGKLMQHLAEFFGAKPPNPLYDPAKSYDAVLYFTPGDHLVRQVAFARRSS